MLFALFCVQRSATTCYTWDFSSGTTEGWIAIISEMSTCHVSCASNPACSSSQVSYFSNTVSTLFTSPTGISCAQSTGLVSPSLRYDGDASMTNYRFALASPVIYIPLNQTSARVSFLWHSHSDSSTVRSSSCQWGFLSPQNGTVDLGMPADGGSIDMCGSVSVDVSPFLRVNMSSDWYTRLLIWHWDLWCANHYQYHEIDNVSVCIDSLTPSPTPIPTPTSPTPTPTPFPQPTPTPSLMLTPSSTIPTPTPSSSPTPTTPSVIPCEISSCPPQPDGSNIGLIAGVYACSVKY